MVDPMLSPGLTSGNVCNWIKCKQLHRSEYVTQVGEAMFSPKNYLPFDSNTPKADCIGKSLYFLSIERAIDQVHQTTPSTKTKTRNLHEQEFRASATFR